MVAVTVETHPDMEGNAEGIFDVGWVEGVIVGSKVGDRVRKVTQHNNVPHIQYRMIVKYKNNEQKRIQNFKSSLVHDANYIMFRVIDYLFYGSIKKCEDTLARNF